MKWTHLRRVVQGLQDQPRSGGSARRDVVTITSASSEPARCDASPPEIARLRAALDPDARAQAFERWKAEQYEAQELERRRALLELVAGQSVSMHGFRR